MSLLRRHGLFFKLVYRRRAHLTIELFNHLPVILSSVIFDCKLATYINHRGKLTLNLIPEAHTVHLVYW